jgi:hypothetical protein
MSEQKEKLLRDRSSDEPSAPPLAQIGLGGMLRHLLQRLLSTRGLVVSLCIHLILLTVAITWVISNISEKHPKQAEFIASGSGGGAAGERAKILEHNLQQKKQKTLAKKVSRITSKNLNAKVVLPDMKSNAMSMDSMVSKLSGSSSKGFGGGSGGGIGAGKGVGVGNMRNFVGKPVMGARINATKVAVFMDASKSMGRYLDRVESEIRKQFPTADVFMYAGVWTNVKDDVIIGGSRYKGTTGRTGAPPVKFTDPDKLTANGKRIFKQYDDNFKTGCVGAWIDIMRNERAYDGRSSSPTSRMASRSTAARKATSRIATQLGTQPSSIVIASAHGYRLMTASRRRSAGKTNSSAHLRRRNPAAAHAFISSPRRLSRSRSSPAA